MYCKYTCIYNHSKALRGHRLLHTTNHGGSKSKQKFTATVDDFETKQNKNITNKLPTSVFVPFLAHKNKRRISE